MLKPDEDDLLTSSTIIVANFIYKSKYKLIKICNIYVLEGSHILLTLLDEDIFS